MFTQLTYQDWTQAADKAAFLRAAISAYAGSAAFREMLTAQRYFRGENEAIARKVVLRPQTFERTDASGRRVLDAQTHALVGNRIGSSFFFRFVTQLNQRLLSFGVTLPRDMKPLLGRDFDRQLSLMGESALVQGVCWGFWNHDHLEVIQAARDESSGLLALPDELTGQPRAAIQFWRMDSHRPLYVRLFEEDGLTLLRTDETDRLIILQPKRAYRQSIRRDGLSETVVEEWNWPFLPLIPLYANPEQRSELTPALRAKIDAYDRILSDFGDNLDRANDVYWVLNNFGGSVREITETLEQIRQLKAVITHSDGMGGASSAEPRTIEVPYAARQTALTLLEKAMYADFMAMNMAEITGGSLTNVAIRTAAANLDLKCDRYEWQANDFVRRVLLLNGVDTDEIRFKRQSVSNDYETVQAIYLMRQDIDRETALRLNPYLQDDEVAAMLERER